MKDLFRSADDVYKTALVIVNVVAGLKNALPETKKALIPLADALAQYECVRFRRRKIIVEFDAPVPLKELTRREERLSRKVRKIVHELDPAHENPLPINDPHDPTKGLPGNDRRLKKKRDNGDRATCKSD